MAESLRGVLGGGVEFVHTRLQLLGVELREEKLRVASLLFSTLLAAIFIGFGLVFFAAFLTVLWWDSHRLLVLGIGSGVLIGAGLLCAAWGARDLARESPLFTDSLAELERDREAIRRSS